jgi:predicted RNase H-like HicB family nuclease
MLTRYIQGAMKRARYEILPQNKTFYGEIPGFDGVYANEKTLEACREELEEVLEDWILLRVSRHLSLPVVDNIDITIKEVA